MKNISRREFVQSLTAAGTVLGFGGIAARGQGGAGLPIGIQLYTVREAAREGFKEALSRVAGIGYRHFEFAGYGELEASELRGFLSGLGVTPCGTHEGYTNFVEDAGKVIQFNRAIGTPYIVVPSMPGDIRQGPATEIEKFAADLNRFGKQVRDAGMQLCYHNHSFEFEKVGGKTIWDIIFESTDPALVKAEVDIAWVYNAGVDPVEHLERWRNRVKLLHMKDMDSNKNLAPVGAGVIDLKSVVAKAKEIGVDWYIVEQDRSREGKDIFDEIALSFQNLSKLLS